MQDALGQYLVYREMLEGVRDETPLYLAVPKKAAAGIFAAPIGELVIRQYKLALIVFDPETEEIVEWRP